MGYQLRAVIAPAGLLRHAAQGHAEMHVIDLTQDMALMPMTEALFDQMAIADGETMGFILLPGGFGETLADWSAGGPVAYVEADFHGGSGTQTAAVWNGGRLVFDSTRDAAEHPLPTDGSPIAQALRRLGVVRGSACDEFEAVGLDRHRDHDGWLAEIGVAPPEA